MQYFSNHRSRLEGSGVAEERRQRRSLELANHGRAVFTYPRVELVDVFPLVCVGGHRVGGHVRQDAVLVHDPSATGGNLDMPG